MGLVQRLAIRKYLKAIRNADLASAEELAEARARIAEAGSAALPSLLELANEGVTHRVLLEVLLPTVTDETLGRVVETLAASEGTVGDFLEKVLAESGSYDPRGLFDLLETVGAARPRVERILRARSKAVRWEAFRDLLRDPKRERIRVVLSMLEMRRGPHAIQVVQPLLEATDPWVRIQALRFLQGCEQGDEEGAAPAIAARLGDQDSTVRRAAASALGALRSRQHLASLCQALRDPDLQVASAAIAALVAIGDPGAVRHLIEVLKDESEYARRAAVEVLNEVATPEAIADLVHALQDEDWWVRVRAADALGALGGERVVDAILALVRSDDVFVRRYAIEILNSIPSEKSVPALIECLSDSDWWVRERAIDALGKTGDPRSVDPLQRQLRSDPQVATLVLGALVRVGEATSLAAIIASLGSGVETVRETARKALRDLARGSTDPEIRKAATRALSQEGQGSEWGDSTLRSEEAASATRAAGGEPGKTPEDRSSKDRPKSIVFRAVGATRIEPLFPEIGLAARGPQSRTRPESLSMNRDAMAPAEASEAPIEPDASSGSASAIQPPTDAKISLMDYVDLPPGMVLLDRYRVVRKIGDGGFGYVYLVMDGSVGEEVILKILAPHISLDASMIKRFVHELKYNRRIVHSNVIRLYDFLELNPGHAISMEYFPSEDLGLVLHREGKLEPNRVLQLVRELCHGLQAAHDSNIVHRDIKPPNILIGADDRVKIVDFGLSAVSGANHSRVTKSGILVGTPQYMSPEQIRGADVDHRADIYALGALLFECLSGAPPYVNENPVSVLMMHLTDPIPSIRERLPDVPDVLEWLIQSSLAKAPEDRPQSIGDILAEIERRAA